MEIKFANAGSFIVYDRHKFIAEEPAPFLKGNPRLRQVWRAATCSVTIAQHEPGRFDDPRIERWTYSKAIGAYWCGSRMKCLELATKAHEKAIADALNLLAKYKPRALRSTSLPVPKEKPASETAAINKLLGLEPADPIKPGDWTKAVR